MRQEATETRASHLVGDPSEDRAPKHDGPEGDHSVPADQQNIATQRDLIQVQEKKQKS